MGYTANFCDFCGDIDPAWSFPTSYKSDPVGRDFLACNICADLVDLGDWAVLLERGIQHPHSAADAGDEWAKRVQTDLLFYVANRSGPRQLVLDLYELGPEAESALRRAMKQTGKTASEILNQLVMVYLPPSREEMS